MLKFNKIWIIFSVLLWLACAQGLFLLVQSSLGQKIVESTQGQFRQELDFSNFNFLARSITDYTTSGSIRCAVLEKVKPEFTPVIDLRYMGTNCKVSPLELKGLNFDVELKSLNGDSYRFQFISNNPTLFDLALWGFRILGILAILGIMMAMKYLAERKLIAYQAEVEVAQKVQKIAMQVSHDIRSPLVSLKMALDELEISKDQNSVIQSSIQRINDIANNLLSSDKIESELSINDFEKLAPIVASVILEKKMQFKDQVHIEIISEIDMTLNHYSKINSVELKRVLSNLINNSIEAFKNPGKIVISLNSTNTHQQIIIQDNGSGIPQMVLSKLGEQRISYGKAETGVGSGSGLGFFHAKTTIESFAGTLKIDSIEDQGTTVTISLPIAELDESPGFYEYVYIDDDKLLRIAWNKKAVAKKVKLLTLESTSEFHLHETKIDKKHTRIYIDSDLGEGLIRGEDFARTLHDLGYEKINIASGHDARNFVHYDWLSFKGKDCPF